MAVSGVRSEYETGSNEIPAGAAPHFGDGATDPLAANNLMILSCEAHQRLRGDEPATFEREFWLRQPGLQGRLEVAATNTPGVVHLHADVRWSESGQDSDGVVHMDADVRESWLAQAAGPEQSAAEVVKALARVAELPRQSTVQVTVDEDTAGAGAS
ncbi:MAG: hypothetical protein ABIP13_04970 [Tepidiformaceae bacterium]